MTVQSRLDHNAPGGNGLPAPDLPSRRRAATTEPPGRWTVPTDAERRAAELDRSLWHLEGSIGAVDRALGLGIEKLIGEGAYRRIGFVRQTDFVREQLGLKPARARWLRKLGQTLLACPDADAELQGGRLSASHVVELRGLISAGLAADELRPWVERASRLTVRELADEVRRERASRGAPEDSGADSDRERRDGTWVNIAAPARVLELWRLSIDLARKFAGEQLPAFACLEAIVADYFARVGDVEAHDEGAEPGSDRDRAPCAGEPAGDPETDATPARGPADVEADSLPTAPVLTIAQETEHSQSDEVVEHRTSRQARWPRLDWTAPADVGVEPPRTEVVEDPGELACILRNLCGLRSQSRLRRAELLEELRDSAGWRYLGFGSFGKYCEERLGFSRDHADDLIRFKHGLDRFQLLRAAYSEGALGFTASLRLLPILHETNEAAWVDWAPRVSTREIERVVEVAALHARPGITPADVAAPAQQGAADPGGGSDAEQVGPDTNAAPEATDVQSEDARTLACADAFAPDGLSGVADLPAPAPPQAPALACADAFAPAAPFCAPVAPDAAPSDSRPPDAAAVDPELARLPEGYALPPSAPRGLPRIAGLAPDAVVSQLNRIAGRVRVWTPIDTARQLERALHRARQILGRDLPDWCYLEVILVHFIQGQDTPEVRRQIERFRIIARDNFQCQVPVCTSRRGLHEHHIRYRGFSGTDDDWNLVTLCAGHHLDGEHRKTSRISGWATDNLFFEIGVRHPSKGERTRVLHFFHGEQRAEPLFVSRAFSRWFTWWRVRQNYPESGRLPVPTEPLTPDGLRAISQQCAPFFARALGWPRRRT